MPALKSVKTKPAANGATLPISMLVDLLKKSEISSIL